MFYTQLLCQGASKWGLGCGSVVPFVALWYLLNLSHVLCEQSISFVASTCHIIAVSGVVSNLYCASSRRFFLDVVSKRWARVRPTLGPSEQLLLWYWLLVAGLLCIMSFARWSLIYCLVVSRPKKQCVYQFAACAHCILQKVLLEDTRRGVVVTMDIVLVVLDTFVWACFVTVIFIGD